MTSKHRAILLPVIAACLLIAGCSERDYGREGLDLQSKQAEQVQAMLDALRDTPPNQLDGYIAAHGASELTAHQTEALSKWLADIRSADAAALTAVDRFGKQVYRATIELPHEDRKRQAYGLLVEVDGQLKWAGPN